MSQPGSHTKPDPPLQSVRQRILLTGATGYVGGLLLPRLLQNYDVRCLVRSPDKIAESLRSEVEIAQGDILDQTFVRGALEGVDVAYYLVHGMGSTDDFCQKDRLSAEGFATAARDSGVGRIIYLGGLGDPNAELSPHLRSRQEVGQILRESGVPTIEFRAAVILGTGSTSFELIRSLTERLPMMITPRWLRTPTQPIAVADVIEYLLEALDIPLHQSEVFEIGCPDVVDYGQLILLYARERNLRRIIIPVPLLTPYLSSLWLGLVTPASAEVGRHLVEGLRNPTIVRDKRAQEVFSLRPMGVREAMHQAVLGSSPATPART